MSKRIRYEVLPNGNGWDVTRNGRMCSHHHKKERAVESGASAARQEGGSQLVIKKGNGQFQSERTYGSDPYPPRG